MALLETLDWSLLMDRQRELEERGVSDGRQRVQRRNDQASQRGTLTRTETGRKMTREAVLPLVKAIQWYLKQAPEEKKRTRGRASNTLKALHWIEKVGVEQTAYLVLKTVVDGLSDNRDVKSVAYDVSRTMMDELRFRKFQDVARHHFTYSLNRFNTTSYTFMARSLRAQMDILDIDTTEFDIPHQEALLLGTVLVSLMIEATGLVERKHRRLRKGHKWSSEVYLQITPEASEWMAKRNRFLEEFFPVTYPMLVPPLSWEHGTRGGYRFNLLGRFSMVRSYMGRHFTQRGPIDSHEMPVVREALNRLQETPWKINQQVLDVVKVMEQRRQGDIAGLPKLDEEDESPPKPLDFATNPVAKKDWVKEVGRIRNRNRDIRIARIPFFKTMNVAETLAEEACFFYPYSCDFRGRIYPIPTFLTPQGNDLEKGLLTFAEGKPLGKAGIFWLAVHGANCLDDFEGRKLSKCSYQDRCDAINGLTERIIATAHDPFSDLWWTEADAPFQFLAFCFEWANMQEGGQEEYVSSLPVFVDGTCNGIQHYCAMFRDEQGGSEVNLLPNERPADLYRTMADLTLDRLEILAAQGDALAASWVTSGMVTRSLVKQPVMTFSYGATMFGFRAQLRDAMKKDRPRWEQAKEHFGFSLVPHPLPGRNDIRKYHVHEGIKLLAKVLWEVMEETVSKAVEGREWLRAGATILAGQEKPVQWLTPVTNFPVKQSYFKSTSRAIKTMLAGKVFLPRIYTPTNKINRKKQENAVAPNIIHSLDAAVLSLTVVEAATQGLTMFGMVHDSYGTLAADMEQLQAITRQEFYRFYTQQDVVGNLMKQFRDMVPEDVELPAPPPVGNLDLGQVLISPYFFA